MAVTHTWTPDEIKTGLTRYNTWVERAVLALYARQTESERVTGQTHVYNGMGFNAYDAPLLSEFAKQLQSGKPLSKRQVAVARKRVMKYIRQLAEIANQKAQA